MRHVLWAGLALMTALGLQPPSANAQLTRSYTFVPDPVATGTAVTSYSGVNVNRNPGSPYYGYVYVCDKSTDAGDPDKGTVKIYRPEPLAAGASATQYVDTGLRILPAPPVSLSPWDVEIGPDDTVWIMALGGNTIQTAPPVPATGTTVTATVQINKTTHTPAGTPTTGGFRGFGVSGPLSNARVVIGETGSTAVQSFQVAASNPSTAGTVTHNYTIAAPGGISAYGVAIDPSGNAYLTRTFGAGASVFAKLDPAGNLVSGQFNNPFNKFSLVDGTFIADSSYPGGGYLMAVGMMDPDGTRSAANPVRVAGMRFSLDGKFIDGFGPNVAAAAGNPRWTVVNLTPRGTSSSTGNSGTAQYGGFDNLGNFYPTNDVAGNGQVSKVSVAGSAQSDPGPWGDVNADGVINEADAAMVEAYIANPNSFTAAQRDRIKRYGDINGTQNHNAIGNGVVNSQDSMRMLLLAGGIIDPGTAGPAPALYGDINGDGVVDLLDAVATQRGANGLGDSATLAVVNTRGRGDISPTVPSISFGDKAITQDDANTIRARAFGTEANAPAYIDHWPLRAPFEIYTALNADTYTFTDVTGRSGDLMHQVTYQTQAPKEVNGFTITEMKGTDDSLIGVYKGTDGSVYAKYLKYPYAFGNRLLVFDAPMKILDNSAITTPGATWSGETSTSPADLGYRPVTYKGTLLANEDVYTPAAGNFIATGDSPKSAWSKTARIRLDVALLAGPVSSLEMQQAFFYDLMPFIGMVNRGQAALRGSAAPTTDRPLLRLDEVRARGITYSPTAP